MVKTLSTLDLLKKVSARLEVLKEDVQHPLINLHGAIEPTSERESAFQVYWKGCTEALPEQPNALSTLFGAVHFLLIRFCGCVPDEDLSNAEDDELAWPCKEQYSSQVYIYDFLGRDLEISVLEDAHYFYLTFNLTEDVLFYDVIVVPKHSLKAIDKTSDKNSLQEYLTTTLDAVYRGMENMKNFMRKRKPRKRYGEEECLTPIFRVPSAAKSPPKKKRQGAATLAYLQLINLTKNKNKAASGGVVLMSIVKTCLEQMLGYKVVDSDNQNWPSTHLAFYPGVCTEQDLKVFPCTVDILDNGKEFYIIFRFTSSPTTCIRKVVYTLLPSLEEKDTAKDSDRIWNLNYFLNEIDDYFIKTVMIKEPESGLTTPTFTSAANTPSKSATCSSRASPRSAY